MFLCETRATSPLFEIFNHSPVSPQDVKDEVFGRRTSPLYCPKVKELHEILLHLEEQQQQQHSNEESKKRGRLR
jgi:hypothetical protein